MRKDFPAGGTGNLLRVYLSFSAGINHREPHGALKVMCLTLPPNVRTPSASSPNTGSESAGSCSRASHDEKLVTTVNLAVVMNPSPFAGHYPRLTKTMEPGPV